MRCKMCGTNYEGQFCPSCGANNMPSQYQNDSGYNNQMNNGYYNNQNVNRNQYNMPPVNQPVYQQAGQPVYQPVMPQPQPKKLSGGLIAVIVIAGIFVVTSVLIFIGILSEEPAGPVVAGTYTDNSYENESLGLGFTLGDNWEFYSDEEIEAIKETADDAVDNESDYEYLMYAYNSNNSNISISKGVSYLSEESIIDQTLKDCKTTYESVGADVDNVYSTTVTVDGKTFNAVKCEVEYGGFNLTQYLLIKKANDNEYIGITLTSMNSDSVEDMLAMFYSL